MGGACARDDWASQIPLMIKAHPISWLASSTSYHHAQPSFLSAVLLLHGVVENNVQEDLGAASALCIYAGMRDVGGTYIIAAQNTNNLAASVQLDKQALVEVLAEYR